MGEHCLHSAVSDEVSEWQPHPTRSISVASQAENIKSKMKRGSRGQENMVTITTHHVSGSLYKDCWLQIHMRETHVMQNIIARMVVYAILNNLDSDKKKWKQKRHSFKYRPGRLLVHSLHFWAQRRWSLLFSAEPRHLYSSYLSISSPRPELLQCQV